MSYSWKRVAGGLAAGRPHAGEGDVRAVAPGISIAHVRLHAPSVGCGTASAQWPIFGFVTRAIDGADGRLVKMNAMEDVCGLW